MNIVSDQGIWIESDVPLAVSDQWPVPLRLVKAVAEGRAADLGRVSPLLAGNLETIRDIFAAWIAGGRKVPLSFELSSDHAAPAKGVSLFFSGGVDSFYSLIKHKDEVDNLVLVHGFDIPLADTKSFALAEAQARDVANIFGKRLIVVRTNLHFEQPSVPGGWGMYHGAALAAVAHALAPNHGKVFIASSASYVDLHPWGSHPLLDPLWSTEAARIVHDGGETRMNKLREVARHPEALARLRVCWEDPSSYNCGLCEKCLRTMLGLRALGVERCEAFPDTLKLENLRRQRLNEVGARNWRHALRIGVPPELRAAAQSAIHSYENGLPPRSGSLKQEINRWRFALLHAVEALVSPIESFRGAPNSNNR